MHNFKLHHSLFGRTGEGREAFSMGGYDRRTKEERNYCTVPVVKRFSSRYKGYKLIKFPIRVTGSPHLEVGLI